MDTPTGSREDEESPDRFAGRGPVQPLSSVRVVDLSDEHGAYCSKLLADLGADVIRVEPPNGDPMRSWRWASSEQGGESPFFAYYHANKRGVTLNLGHDGSRELLSRLLLSADAVVTSGPDQPVVADVTEAIGESLVVADVTSYGGSGPHSSFLSSHLTTYAMSGLMIDQGDPEAVPVVIPGIQMYDEAGVQAATGMMVALSVVRSVGGQKVSVAAQEVLGSQLHHIPRYGMFGFIPERSSGVMVPPSGDWHCADGLVTFQVWESRQWAKFVDLLGAPGELSDPGLGDRITRREQAAWLAPLISERVAEWTVGDLVERAQAAGIPCSKVNRAADLWSDAQLRDRGFFVRVEGEGRESAEFPGPPYRLPEGWWRLRRPAPRLGEHNAEIYVGELGFSESDLVAWKASGVV